MIVLGIDSAELTGFAVVDGERLIRHGTIHLRTAADVEAAAAELAAHVPEVVAVEEPFVHPRNPSTGLTLARLLGRWLQAFEARGFTTVAVPPSMWQPAVLRASPRAPEAPSAKRRRWRSHGSVSASRRARTRLTRSRWPSTLRGTRRGVPRESA